MQSDGELLAAWQRGDREAGGVLIDRHVESLRRFFEHKVTEGIEDLIQQTFLACVRNRDNIAEAFRAYLFAAARSKLYDYIRQRTNAPGVADFSVSSLDDLGVSPSERLARDEDRRLLLHGLRKLPLELQITLELYYFEGVRGQELEIALGIPLGTVRSRLRRGIELLRKHIKRLASSPEALHDTSANLDRWAADLREVAED